MLKTKKIMMSLLLAALLSIVFSGFNNHTALAATGNEVELLHANWFLPSVTSNARVAGSIEVENIAYHKEVNVVYRYTTDTANGNMTWNKFAAAYAAPTEGNYEAWEFEMPVNYVYLRPYYTRIEFYIEYIVDGNRYVDDNGGNYYYIGHSDTPSIIMNKPAVKMAGDGPDFKSDDNFAGGVYVKNLGSDKEVKIVYTTDNWTTLQQAWAQYYSTDNGLELWKFDISVDPSVKKVEMAVLYVVDGVQYWDTNYNNRNYIVER